MTGLELLLLFVLAVGVGLFVVGSLMVRRSNARSIELPPVPITWTNAFDDTPQAMDVPMRLEMIERLALIDEPWSESLLQMASDQETDPDVAAAIAAALREPD